MEIRPGHVYTGIAAFGILEQSADPNLWRGVHQTGIGGPIVGIPRRPMIFGWKEAKEDVVGTSAVALYSNRDQLYRKSPIGNQGEKTDWVWLKPEFTAELVSEFDPQVGENHDNCFRRMSAPASSSVVIALRQLTASRNHALDVDPLALDEAAISILRSLIAQSYEGCSTHHKRSSSHSTDRAHTAAVNDVAEMIGQQFHRKLSLEDVASSVCISPLHFCRIFKQRTGMTVHTYLTRVRVAYALELLADTPYEFANIALRSGFASSSHMSDVFARMTHGSRPTTAQQMVRSGIPTALRSLDS